MLTRRNRCRILHIHNKYLLKKSRGSDKRISGFKFCSVTRARDSHAHALEQGSNKVYCSRATSNSSTSKSSEDNLNYLLRDFPNLLKFFVIHSLYVYSVSVVSSVSPVPVPVCLSAMRRRARRTMLAVLLLLSRLP